MHRQAVRLSAIAVTAAAAITITLTTRTQRAEACGCFAPPDPSVPIVQAGERIVFDLQDGIVTAHIQVQYSGPASEFGWLLPMPSVPALGVGTGELFTQVINTTQPKYTVNYSYKGNCPFDPNNGGGFGNSPSGDSSGDGDGDGDGGVLIFEDSIGPYEVAVLAADAKQPMLDWLSDNGYFIPAGTDDVVDAYIRPGAYFLALKLQKGKDVGDLQPVVARYRSDLPMIPIILTSVAAQADMGVQVWVLGDSRAIPKNFFHTQINDARVNWFTFGDNYAKVVTRAVDEANGHNSFVTEYAGTTQVMRNQLLPQGRFGSSSELRNISDPISYISYMNNNGYPVFNNNTGAVSYTSETLAVLDAHLPLPPQLAADGITATDYYFNIDFYLGQYFDANPGKFTDADLVFDPLELTAELDERVVEATRLADRLFTDNRFMTRLFTTLSPHEMLKDPVFSFNPDLPEVSNVHTAEATYFCGLGGNNDPATTPIVLKTEQGFKLSYPEGNGIDPFSDIVMPWAFRTQILREEGDPENVDDNEDEIRDALDFGGGCSVAGGAGGAMTVLFILGAAFTVTRRRRRRRNGSKAKK